MLERSCFLNAAAAPSKQNLNRERKTSKRNGKNDSKPRDRSFECVVRRLALTVRFSIENTISQMVDKISTYVVSPFSLKLFFSIARRFFYVNVNRDSYSSSTVEFVVADCVGFVDW